MPSLNLPRELVAQIAGGNRFAITQLEAVFKQVSDTPATIEEANALAGSALAVAHAAVAALAMFADALSQMEAAPAVVPQVDPDDTAPRAHLGTIASQNADSIEVTGGTIDNTPIGSTTAADAKFKKVSASDQITSTVATGTAPFVVASTTRVSNLNVAAAGTADSLTSPTTYNAPATDLPTVIALANQLRAAAISKGL
jgi:hypothetical protein